MSFYEQQELAAGDHKFRQTVRHAILKSAIAVAVRQWSATTNDPGVTLTSTPDQLCITVDPAIAPSAITVTTR